MKGLSQEQIQDYLCEWNEILQSLSDVRNPFAQIFLLQTKAGELFSKIYKEGYKEGLVEKEKMKRIIKSN